MEALCKLGLALTCIAEQLGERSERTIRREIGKGTVELVE